MVIDMIDESLITAQKIIKKFGDHTVLSGLDLEIRKGDFTVVMGTSGSGKSTLLYCLSGMDEITEGSVLFEGNDISKMSERELEDIRGSKLGFVFQDANLVSNLTVRENIMISAFQAVNNKKVADKKVVKEVDELLGDMGLSEIMNHFPSEISCGEAQRAAIARAAIKHPEIMFADEPTGALNRSNTEEVLKLLIDLNREGQTILMVTHSKEAALCGNRVIYLEDGQIKNEINLYGLSSDEKESRLDAWLKELRW